mgnify:CR=1 FL=1
MNAEAITLPKWLKIRYLEGLQQPQSDFLKYHPTTTPEIIKLTKLLNIYMLI